MIHSYGEARDHFVCPPFASIPVRGGHHHGERLRAADALLRGFFVGTIKAGAGVMTPGPRE